MRSLLSVVLAGALAWCGCAHKRVAYQPLSVTPETGLVGKVAIVNTTGRFVVLNFPLAKVPAVGQTLNLYRGGLKVGEVRISGPQRDENIVADLVAGDAVVGDDARSQ